MQYLLLIYEAEEIFESKSDDEKREVLAQHQAMQNAMDNAGVTWTGQPLMPTATAKSVQVKGTQSHVRDGPFAETKEQLGGFYLVDVPTLEDAVKYAAMLPHAVTGTMEVRAVADHSQDM